MPVTLRPLGRPDFPLLSAWLAEPLVARWWCHETSLEAVERDFGASVDGRDPTEVLLAALDGRTYGLVQRYEIAAEPKYLAELATVCAVPDGALSIDYLVGETWARGCGLGTAMIETAVAEAWLRHPDARDVLVPVAAGNRASWRALERAGFSRVAEGELEPDNPVDPRDHYVYGLRRPVPSASTEKR